jgi:hypothetical protein
VSKKTERKRGPLLTKAQRQTMVERLSYWWQVGTRGHAYALTASKIDPTGKGRADLQYWRHYLATVKWLIHHAAAGKVSDQLPDTDGEPL